MKLRKDNVDKPPASACCHYYDEDVPGGKYVGAVFNYEDDDRWYAHCSASQSLYGHLGSYESEYAATKALMERLKIYQKEQDAKARQGSIRWPDGDVQVHGG